MEKRPGETAGRSVAPRLGTARGQEGAGRVAARPTRPAAALGSLHRFSEPRVGWRRLLPPSSLDRVGAPTLTALGLCARWTWGWVWAPPRALTVWPGAALPAWSRRGGYLGSLFLSGRFFLGWPRLRRYPPALAQ